MTRNAYVLHDHRLVLFWTQKGANTSLVHVIVNDILKTPLAVQQAVFKRRRPDDSPDELEPVLLARVYLNNHGDFRVEPAEARALVTREGYRSLALLREPYDRLVSAFINKFVQDRGQPKRSLADLDAYARNLYRQLPLRLGYSRTHFDGLTFFDFVRFVARRVARLDPATGEPTINEHFNSQVPLAQRREGFRYDHAFNIRQSEAYYACLSRMVGKTLRAPVFNASPMADTRTPNLSKTNSLEIAALPQFGARQFENQTLKRLVQRVFADDYHYYNSTL